MDSGKKNTKKERKTDYDIYTESKRKRTSDRPLFLRKDKNKGNPARNIQYMERMV